MTRAWLVVLALGGCGSEGLAAAELDAVCGADGPVRVLALEPGEVLSWPVLQIGDRTIYAISRHAPMPDAATLSLSFAAIWSTGPCGEAPVRLDPGAGHPYTRERWPDVLLAPSSDERDILVVDPLGGPSHAVFTDIGTPRGWADAGMIATRPDDESSDAVYLYPYPDDPRTQTATPVRLLDGVPPREQTSLAPRTLEVSPDALRVRDVRGDLMRVELADGAVSLEQAGVWDFSASPDGRWLVWQDIKPIDTELTDVFAGEVYLRDTADGSDVFLAVTSLVGQGAMWNEVERGLFTLDMGPEVDARERVYSLDTLTFVELPEHRSLDRVLDDGRWLLSTLGWQPRVLFDPASGEETGLFAGNGTVVGRPDDGFEIVEVPPCCITGRPLFEEGPLWWVPFAGAPRQVAERATRYGLRLGDGRRVTTLDVDDETLGEFVVLDTDARTAAHIDDRVFALGMHASEVHDGAILYSVDDGERTGVWLARLSGQ
jgi:hypothetical protein